MIPSRVYIKGELYEIVYQRLIDKPDDLGYCDDDKKILYIKLGLSDFDELDAFIHEMLHALTHRHKIRISHGNLDKLATALAHFVTDNTNLLQLPENK